VNRFAWGQSNGSIQHSALSIQPLNWFAQRFVTADR
jgi:hypothetical protein